MKKENVLMHILRLTVTLLLICGAVAAVLAGVNAITKDRIAAIQVQKTTDAIAEVLPGADQVEELPLTGDTGIVTAVYAAQNGYAVKVAPNGFNGTVTMMVGIVDGKVTGISVISHTETPGLGAVAAADSAKGEAFRGRFVGLGGELAVDKDGGQVDSLTSATITSRTVTAGVNAALAYVAELG